MRIGQIGGALNRGDEVSYNEEFTYDKQGNILALQRNAQGKEIFAYTYNPLTGKPMTSVVSCSAIPIDKLSMEYEGNRLMAVTDEMVSSGSYSRKEYHDLNTSGHDFAYDANGNMLVDRDRGILSVKYNVLNLPENISFSEQGDGISNSYWADGSKSGMNVTSYVFQIISTPIGIDSWRTDTTDTITPPDWLLTNDQSSAAQDSAWQLKSIVTNYFGNLLQEVQVSPREETYRLLTSEGYVDSKGNYHYYRRDHLGNIREVWKPSGDSTLTLQRTRYYQSLLPWEYQAGDSAILQPYKPLLGARSVTCALKDSSL